MDKARPSLAWTCLPHIYGHNYGYIFHEGDVEMGFKANGGGGRGLAGGVGDVGVLAGEGPRRSLLVHLVNHLID